MLEPTNKNSIKVRALLIAILLLFVNLYFPIFEQQEPQRAFALLLFAAILWITEAIPLALTGLLIPVIAILMRIAEPTDAFKQFAHPIIFLFMGGFALANALSIHSLDKLIAQKLVNLAKGNFYRSAVFLMFTTAIMACWVTNTSAAAMMIPLGIGLLVLIKKNEISRESKFLMLGIAYSANIGGIITMVASPPNAIGAAILNLSFSKWILVALPLFLLVFPIMVLVLTIYFKPDRQMKISELSLITEEIKPNKTLIAIFSITVLLWILDSVLSPMLNIKDSFSSLVAIFAIFLLFVTSVMKWDAIIKSINWEILLLFGGGLTLGTLIDSSGLGGLLIGHASQLITIVPLWLFLWIIVIFSIILTEFMSNTASAALILPLLFTLAIHLKINPMILVFPATIAASFGFMMPVGTPPNAMVFATDLIPRSEMLKAGLVMNLISSIVVTAFFYFIFY